MSRLPLYYFNTVHGTDVTGIQSPFSEAPTELIWSEINEMLDTLQHPPKKMYAEGLFTYNNRLLVIPPETVPQMLNDIYEMPQGFNKMILLKLARMGVSLVPCEERELLIAWRKGEREMAKKESLGHSISAEEIGKQSLYLLTRNKVIGEVISQTLTEDEAGVLFLSYFHNFDGLMVENYLKETLGLNVIEMNPHVRGKVQ